MKVSVTLQEISGEILMPIPDELLAELGISDGTDVDVRSVDGRIVIEPLLAPAAAETPPEPAAR